MNLVRLSQLYEMLMCDSQRLKIRLALKMRKSLNSRNRRTTRRIFNFSTASESITRPIVSKGRMDTYTSTPHTP